MPLHERRLGAFLLCHEQDAEGIGPAVGRYGAAGSCCVYLSKATVLGQIIAYGRAQLPICNGVRDEDARVVDGIAILVKFILHILQKDLFQFAVVLPAGCH